MKKLSVIIPVYNTEIWLPRCVDSVINQTYPEIEIILVDDGSTDSSGKICDNYASKDERIKVIHKTNGGLSDARNAGLEIANGEFISFVDSDDYISINMYESLIKTFYLYKNENAIVCSGSVQVCGRVEKELKFEKKEFNKEELLYGILFHKNPPSIGVCDKLFPRHFFDNLRFPIGKINEDFIVMAKIYKNAERMYITTNAKYYYCTREDSITQLSYNKASLNYLEIAKLVNKEAETLCYPFVQDGTVYNMCLAYRVLMKKMYIAGVRDLNWDEGIRFTRENGSVLLMSKYLAVFQKLKLLLCGLCPSIYFFLVIHIQKYGELCDAKKIEFKRNSRSGI